MLPHGGTKPNVPPGLLYARLQLYALKLARERPVICILLVLLALAGFPMIVTCVGAFCSPCTTTGTGATASHTLGVSGLVAAPAVDVALPPRGAAATGTVTMADVVVGIMTCRRFHRTRCRAQLDTWLRRARRVVFFTDTAEEGTSAELRAPVIAHTFKPSEFERIFSGGNWRAVPILRALAEHFFSAPAQARFAARHEPLPKWIYMADDDSYAFTPTMLATLAKYNPDQPHYLGYAFIAAPHLEGVIPGKRQPLFANGGAGICVSRGALVAALPVLAKCELEYTWNWPGDVRVAQCLVDAGIKVEWVRTFHAEAPGVIVHKKRPPPGSVPVGLVLPPPSEYPLMVSDCIPHLVAL